MIERFSGISRTVRGRLQKKGLIVTAAVGVVVSIGIFAVARVALGPVVGTAADWLSGTGSIAAAVVALHLVRSDEEKRQVREAQAFVAHSDPKSWTFTLTNAGLQPLFDIGATHVQTGARISILGVLPPGEGHLESYKDVVGTFSRQEGARVIFDRYRAAAERGDLAALSTEFADLGDVAKVISFTYRTPDGTEWQRGCGGAVTRTGR